MLFLYLFLGVWAGLAAAQAAAFAPGIEIDPLQRLPSLSPDPKRVFKSQFGGVSSDIPQCSQLGVGIMKKGGSAADAAVTVALCLGLINSFNSGIGGGAYIVSKQFKQDAISIDAREMAPVKSHKDMFKHQEHLSKVGGLAPGVPGEVKGLYELYTLQGSGNLTWRQLLEPVIDIAHHGWNCSEVLSAVVYLARDKLRANYHDWSYLFKRGSTSELVQTGDLMFNHELGHTLELIAEHGAAVFYNSSGPIASHLIRKVNDEGGIFTPADFDELYKVEVYPSLKTTFLGNEVHTCAGTCSGPALISGLNIMDRYGECVGCDMAPVPTQRLIEAMKWMASARSRLGDPTNNQTAYVTSAEWSDMAYSHINDSQTLANYSDYHPLYEITESHGTTHFSIVDSNHNAIAMTSTINLLFGSFVRDPVTGIILNNQMDDFSTPGVPNTFGVEPSIYNFIKPGKRPLSSTAPTIVVNELGKPELVIGSAGGSRIVTAIFQAIVRIYSYKIPLLETIAYPRLHHQLLPYYIEHEPFIGSDIIGEMIAKGHDLVKELPKTAMNGIHRFRGEYHFVSDFWRKRAEPAVL